MRSDELGNEVEDQIARLWTRIMGVGQEQYEGEDGVQKFETMSLEGLFEYAREELDDIIVYAVMLRIRLNRAEQAVNTTGVEAHPSRQIGYREEDV